MQENPPPATGVLGSLRTLGAGLAAGLHERVALLALELQEEKYRLIQTLVWIGAVQFTAAMALIFASLTLVLLFWENGRLAVVGGLAVLYGLTFAVLVAAFRRYLARQPRPLAATLEELQEDETCIRGGN